MKQTAQRWGLAILIPIVFLLYLAVEYFKTFNNYGRYPRDWNDGAW